MLRDILAGQSALSVALKTSWKVLTVSRKKLTIGLQNRGAAALQNHCLELQDRTAGNALNSGSHMHGTLLHCYGDATRAPRVPICCTSFHRIHRRARRAKRCRWGTA